MRTAVGRPDHKESVEDCAVQTIPRKDDFAATSGGQGVGGGLFTGVRGRVILRSSCSPGPICRDPSRQGDERYRYFLKPFGRCGLAPLSRKVFLGSGSDFDTLGPLPLFSQAGPGLVTFDYLQPGPALRPGPTL